LDGALILYGIGAKRFQVQDPIRVILKTKEKNSAASLDVRENVEYK
jgi:hypothetical protein